jgi:hypothetical protein
MKRYLAILAMLSVALSASGQAFSQSASGIEDLSKPVINAPPMLGIHWARGFDPNFRAKEAGHGGSGGGHQKKPPPLPPSPNMSYHGGKIMPTAVTANIFWGKNWGTYSGEEITGLDYWSTGFSNSNYAKTSDEYTGTNGQVGSATTFLGHIVDTTAATGGNNTSAILAEVCKAINPDPSGNGYYAVYTDLPRGSSGYCAWHSAGSCGGVPVQFAFFWKLDGDSGCDPQSGVTTESEGLAALANVSGHELSEARSDPASPGAWYDSTGQENGDKCVWTFNVPYVTFSNSTIWKIQGEWSNPAYTGTGYPNSAGQKGCLDGH